MSRQGALSTPTSQVPGKGCTGAGTRTWGSVGVRGSLSTSHAAPACPCPCAEPAVLSSPEQRGMLAKGLP